MRGVLVLIGLLIGLVVAFLAAWPQLVEVPALREQIAGMIRESAGAELRLEGAVRLEILPRPRVTIERAVIGDRIAVGPGSRFSADRIDIDLAVLPLLAGRLEPRGLQLVRPALTLSDLSGASPERLLAALTAGSAAAIDRVEVVDGSVELTGAAPMTVSSIDLGLVRDTGGAFDIGASMAAGQEPLHVTVQGGPLAFDQPVPLQVAAEIGPKEQSTSFDFSGHVRISHDGSSAQGRVSLDASHGRLPIWLSTASWPAAGLRARLNADAASLSLADLELTLPEGELRGSATLALDAGRRLELSLEGTSLELSPALLDALERVADSTGGGGAGSGTVRVDLASVNWGNGQLRRIMLDAGWSADGLDLRTVEAVLPGQTAFQWRGSGPQPPGSPLAGALAVQSGDVRGLLAWLGSDLALLPEGGLTSLDLKANATVARDRLALTELDARLDASSITGKLAFELGPRRRADLDLQVDRLNTALYAPWPDGWALWRSRLEALDGSLALKVDQVSHDVLRGHELVVQGKLDAARLELTTLRLADLAGATVELAGVVDLPLGAWDLHGSLALARSGPLQRLLGIGVPFALDRFAPLRLTAASRREAGVSTIDLNLSGTGADASVRGQLEGKPDDGPLELTLAADAAELRDLLEALGWPAPPDASDFGPVSAQATLSRDTGPVLARMTAAVAGSSLNGEARITTAGGRPALAGNLALDSLDTSVAAAIYHTLALPLGFPPGDPWLWPGAWPRQPMRWDWLDAIDLDLAVEAGRIRQGRAELGAAGFAAKLTDGDLELRDVRLPLAGGRLSGNATLEGGEASVVLGTELRLEGARIESFAMTSAAGSAISGQLDLQASLLGEGRSTADIVRTLSGEGSLALPRSNLPDLGLDGLSLEGSFALDNGILTAPLSLSYPAGQGSLEMRMDLLAWILSATLKLGGTQRSFVGAPGRIAAVPSGTLPP